MTAEPLSLFDAFDDAPLPVRSSDPATSKQSARRLNLRQRKRQVMDAIGVVGDRFTADDVLRVLRQTDQTWERGWVASRLSQLATDDLVKPSGVARGRFDTEVMVFHLTPTGRLWLIGAVA